MSRFNRTEKRLIAILVILHLAIVIPLAVTLSLGNAEAASLEITSQGLGHAINGAIGSEPQPPLYFAALNVWRQVFGDSLFTARLLSIACTVSALGVLAAVSQRYLPRIHCPRLSPKRLMWNLPQRQFSSMSWRRTVLKRSRTEQEVDDVPLVRLQPVHLQRPDFADVESVDVPRV